MRALQRISNLAVGLALLTLTGACAPHGSAKNERDDDPPSRRDPPPEPGPDVPPPPDLPPEPEPELALCLREGPTTPLQLKPYAGAAGDITGDGQLDVVALSYTTTGELALVILEGRRDGTFIEREALASGGSGLELGDLDGDADLDVILLDGGGAPRYRVVRNDGAGQLQLGPRRRIPGSFGGELRHASIVDLNGDGALDVVVPLWDSVRALVNRGDGRLRPGPKARVGRDPFSTAVADLDGDGRLDLAVVSGAGVEQEKDAYHSAEASLWRFRGRARGWEPTPTRLQLPGARRVLIADLEDDGALEVLATGENGLTITRGFSDASVVRVPLALDGPLLVADVAARPGHEIITSSYMLSGLTITSLAPELEPTSTTLHVGSFVVEMFAADVARDATAPDVVLLSAGPPGGAYGEPNPGITTLFVDCPAR